MTTTPLQLTPRSSCASEREWVGGWGEGMKCEMWGARMREPHALPAAHCKHSLGIGRLTACLTTPIHNLPCRWFQRFPDFQQNPFFISGGFTHTACLSVWVVARCGQRVQRV